MKEKIYLTPREKQIVSLMAEGHARKEVGPMLEISWETVKSHLYNIRIRLEAKNIRHIIAISRSHGIL